MTGTTRDALIIGGGMTGIYQLHRLAGLGLDVRLVEQGDGVGGTWYWNRYPNARFDSESYTYGYLFDDELFRDWQWSEHFAAQPEIERYLNHVVDRFELRDRIDLGVRVESARWDEDAHEWEVRTGSGPALRTRILLTAVGCLSRPIYPTQPGLDTFRGEWHHTGRWPHEPVDFAGKRVAVVGTGSSGVQVVPTIARSAASLSVFQRTPNWCTPLNNRPVTTGEQDEIGHGGAAAMRDRVDAAWGGFLHAPVMVSAHDVDADERRALFERLYHGPGLVKMIGNYWDVGVDPAANELFNEFVAEKIRARIDDPAVAEKLVPRDHGYGQKRPPMEDGYYEVFNQDNVELVDLSETPLERFTERGIRTSDREREFDLIVVATGWDFVTGAFDDIEFSGTAGRTLRRHWDDGPVTHMGIFSSGFPNLLMVGGAHSTYGNMPRSAGVLADVATEIVGHMREQGHTRVETTAAAEQSWTKKVADASAPLLITKGQSFFVGSNVPGKARGFLAYPGASLPEFRDDLRVAAGDGFAHLEFR